MTGSRISEGMDPQAFIEGQKMQEIRFHGRGGQGTVVASILLAKAFFKAGYDVQTFPLFGVERRGAPVEAYLRLDKEKILTRILTETTSSGARYYNVTRRALPRKQFETETSYGKVRVKEITRPDGSASIVPEFDDCKAIALEKDIPVKLVYETIQREAGESKNKP